MVIIAEGILGKNKDIVFKRKKARIKIPDFWQKSGIFDKFIGGQLVIKLTGI